MSDPADNQPIPGRRGRLKIFLGYATGVGKTYAMLQAARQRLAEGVAVVVGQVESHGAPATEALLAEFDALSRAGVANRPEIDTDAIRRLKPDLVLVDDLAHLNAPGCRHVHRYQDVLELLGSGIDVYATVNIQHLESLNDVVSRVTGYVVQATVPDHIFDEADEVELVDLPVAELLARFEAGQVPIPPDAEAALRQFYRPGNLTALREMALRRAAERVDEQMRAYMQAHAISGPWPAGDRLLVCVGPSPLSERLVRTTRRLARRLDAEWIAAYVEVPDARPLSADDAERVAATLQLAEALGARSVRLTGPNVAATLVDFARSRNVTKIVAGKPLRPRWRDWRRGSIIDQILARSQGLDVYVISGETTVAPPPIAQVIERRPMAWRGYLVGLLLVLLATLVGLPLRATVNPTNLVMLYLVVVMLTAIWLGRRAAFLVSLSSVLVFDFMFVPPYYELGVADAEYLLTFAGLLAMGLVISTLATRARREAVAARRREAQTAVLFELSQSLAAAAGQPEIAQAVVVQVGNAFNSPAALLLPAGDDGSLRIQASSPDFYAVPAELGVADWVYQHGGPAGKHTDTHAEANGYYLPLQTSGETIGVLAVALPADYYPRLTAEQRRFLASFANQVALALENAQLAEQARRTRLLEETEKLQTTLLNSISHDLRTPLATITGALSSLLDDEALLSAAARRELALTAFDEALRLNRLVGNLLDMTRLESGAMKVVCQPYDVQELVGATLAQMRNRLQGYTVQRQIPFDLPPVNIDLTLMVQALLNLIDNVVKYAPPDEPIEIEARLAGLEVILAVKDRGPGLPEADLPHIFNKFFRLAGSSGGGTGLGLSIARGIVEAHGGRIQAENRPDGGAVFSFTMPVAQVDLPLDA